MSEILDLVKYYISNVFGDLPEIVKTQTTHRKVHVIVKLYGMK